MAKLLSKHIGIPRGCVQFITILLLAGNKNES